MYIREAGEPTDPPGARHQGSIRQPGSVDDLPIGVLHLGVKTATLERAGFRTVGDLASVTREQIIRIPTVGWRTADLLSENRQALIDASDAETGTDWDRYCETTRIPLLPHEGRPSSGKDFLASLPDFLAGVADNLADETFSAILRERICQPPERQKTLDEIAATTSPPVTRERIRQKEKKLLGQLTGGLLNETYGTLGIHFRPEFSIWWKRAADRLSHLEEIEFTDFVEALSAEWEVPNHAVITQLPIILAIVTGEPQMSGEFRAASRVDPRLFGDLRGEVLGLPLNRLRLGRYAERLAEAGSETVGDIVARLRAGSLGARRGKADEVAAMHANQLASCLRDDGLIDWRSYRTANALSCLPASPTVNAAEFVATLRETVCDLLTACRITKRASEIYRLRTSRTLGSQMTLQAVADALDTHLPTVKREETVFLSFLNGVLIGHDFSKLPVWLDDLWLKYWDEARASYESARDNYGEFSENLAWKWRLTVRDIGKAAPTIWAVLSGYPNDRRSKRAISKAPVVNPIIDPDPQLPAGRIRLRGFRRVH
ncbi:hypothetical protein AMC99_00058 [Altererythrobacter epoxidivorans]|uniref:RNA polymerase alpha subunit C-terminal domain-containing protein n=1 Tax=Altererythrobacter epoxidivorans TaxID=361183 RepID=A0A0M5KXZ4_9SPHN|nr:hypothetical protein AMC99_00058 [Altererythrobacter epoxidivorans]